MLLSRTSVHMLFVLEALISCVMMYHLSTAPLRGIPSSRTPSSAGFIRSSSLAGRFGSSTPLGTNRSSASHKEGGIKVAACPSNFTTAMMF